MSVSLNPGSALGFNRPLTQLVKKNLTISNHNKLPVAFKVKTTAPKLYCVRPNSGRIEPGESIDVSVMLQAMKEEPPLPAKCKDKFLIQSTAITPERESMSLQDIWNPADSSEELKVHQQKLKVNYLPQEGQTVEEEDENLPANSAFTVGEQNYKTVRGIPNGNGEVHAPGGAGEPRPPSPGGEFVQAADVSHHEEPAAGTEEPPAPPAKTDEEELPAEHSPLPPVPVHAVPSVDPIGIAMPAVTTSSTDAHDELAAKYSAAQAEISRLRALLAATPQPTTYDGDESTITGTTGLRHRNRGLTDDGLSTAAPETETGSYAGETMATTLQQTAQEGVPLQVVVLIALGVFVTTYLFF